VKSLFLSASVPVKGRGTFHETADPFLIHSAVRDLVTVTIRQNRLVWGGHPAITPMIWAICEDLDVAYSDAVVLYQSTYFKDEFPEENGRFKNVRYIDHVPGDLAKSLRRMREAMLGEDLQAAVFIGGMEGVFDEFEMFRTAHRGAKVLPVASPGGAALELAKRMPDFSQEWLRDVDYVTAYYRELGSVLDLGQKPFSE
jgi:hypothetical protein